MNVHGIELHECKPFHARLAVHHCLANQKEAHRRKALSKKQRKRIRNPDSFKPCERCRGINGAKFIPEMSVKAKKKKAEKKKPRNDYFEYINSKAWKRKRLKAIEFYGGFCTLCGNPGRHVHHLTYKRLGRERMEDLRLLCPRCHMMLHEEAITRRASRRTSGARFPQQRKNVAAENPSPHQ